MLVTRIFLAAVILSVSENGLHAQAPAASSIPRYPGIRTQFNQNLSRAQTNEQRLELYRQTVGQGRYSGHPMLMRMFGNFAPTSFNLPPTKGVSDTVLLLASDNRNVVKGYARTLRYAMSLQRDGQFKVLDLNERRVNSVGRTDADIVFRHQATGLQGRMEVKNMSLSSQRANLPKIQRQMLKMAQDARLTGEIQIWANRQGVLPEVRAFAERHGITVSERIRTGNSGLRSEDLRFGDFANGMDNKFRIHANYAALAGTIRLGMGAYMAYQTLRQMEGDLSDFGGTNREWLRLVESSSMLAADIRQSFGEAVHLSRQIPSFAKGHRLLSLTRWGGRLGLVGVAVGEGFLVTQYVIGDLTERQFFLGQASLGGGIVGGTAGGFVGFKAGAAVGGGIGFLIGGPPGAAMGAATVGTLGAIGGGFGGGYAGAHFAGRGMHGIYQLQDAAQQERFAEFLLSHYQSP